MAGLSELVSFLPTLGSFFVNDAQNKENMALQYRYSSALASQQNQANVDMWNRNNEYNSPLQQMARFKAAGLNPQLAYGNMPQSDAPAMVGGSTPISQASPLSGTDMNQAALLNAQKENIEADTADKLKDLDVKGSQISLNSANARLLAKQYDWTEKQLEVADKQIESIDQQNAESQKRVEEMTQNIKLLKANTDKTEYEAFSAYVDSLFAQLEHSAAYKESLSRANLSNAEAKRIVTLLPFEQNEIDQHTRNMKKEQVLLIQAIKTGKIPADIASKFPNFLEFLTMWREMQGIVQMLPIKVK